LGDIGPLTIDIRLDQPRRASSAANFTPPSLGNFPIGGDGRILSGADANVMPARLIGDDSIDLLLTYVVRDASGNAVGQGVEAIKFISFTHHAWSYQTVFDRIAKRVAKLRAKTG
jgi:hypothetical protein